jgi:hypothetical protein
LSVNVSSLQVLIADIAARPQRFAQALKSGRLQVKDTIATRENYAYVYKRNTLGMGRSGAAEPQEADDRTGAMPFTVSVFEEDRDGDLVVPAGCHLEDYSANPVVFFGHQSLEIPIGVSRDRHGRVTVFPMQDRIKAICYFDRADPDADFIYGKARRGILSAASIAFIPIEAYRREEVEKAQTHGNRPMGMPLGWLFKQYSLTEWSIVGIPSCAGAVRDALDSEKSFISPRLQKGLSAYAAQTKGCWGGWCPLPKEAPMRKKHCCHNCEKGWPCECHNQEKMINQALMEDGTSRPPDNPAAGIRPGTQALDEDDDRDAVYKEQPSADVDSAKACQIMRDGEIDGKPLTEAQRGMFGAACGRSQKGSKAMTSTSSQAGGYLTNSGKVEENNGKGSELTDNEAPGYESCPTCDGSGNCSHCQGTGYHGHEGEECDQCDGTGNCPTCAGMGLAEKTSATAKSRRKAMRKAAPPIEDTEDEDTGIPQAHEAGKSQAPTQYGAYQEGEGIPEAYDAGKNLSGEPLGEVGEATPPEGVGAGVKGAESEPFNPKPSAAVVARLYAHNKAAMDYLDQELTNMDNPAMKAWLDGHKMHYAKAMEDLSMALGEHHPDYEMEKLCKALETEVPPPTDIGLEGEAGMVGGGNIPEEHQPPPPTPPDESAYPESEAPDWMMGEEAPIDSANMNMRSEGTADANNLGTPPFNGNTEGQASDYGTSAVPEAPYDEQMTPDEEGQGLYPTPRLEEEAFATEPQDAGQAPYLNNRSQAGKGGLMEGDSGIPDTDADTEEILERYRHPKSGKMMIHKVGRLRRTPDGRTYIVRYNKEQYLKANAPPRPRKKLEHPTTGEFIEGSGHSEELDEGERPAPYNKQLIRDVGGAGEFLADISTDVAVTKAYRTVAKFHAERLGYVAKELSNKGRYQRNSGGGRALSDKGRTQSDGGSGDTLSERGQRQADSRSRAQIVGSGTPQGLSEGTRPAPYNKSRRAAAPPARRPPAKAAPPVVDRDYQAALNEFAAVKRMFKEYGITH